MIKFRASNYNYSSYDNTCLLAISDIGYNNTIRCNHYSTFSEYQDNMTILGKFLYLINVMFKPSRPLHITHYKIENNNDKAV